MKIKNLLLLSLCIISINNLLNAQNWSLTGNSGTNPGTNFLGTTDKKALVLRTNNKERIRILPNGKVGIGLSNPKFLLDVNGNINIADDSAYYIGSTRVFSTPFGHNLIIGQDAAHDLQPYTHDNTTCGEQALSLNESGNFNTAIGGYSLYGLDGISNNNTATGFYSLGGMEGGGENCGFGAYALGSMTFGTCNVGVGVNALKTKGSTLGLTGSTAVGYNALLKSTFGDYNSAVGYNALQSIFAGSANTAIGSFADVNDSTDITNSTAVGYQALITASNQVRVGNKSVKSIGGYVGWSNISDGRVKKNIKADVPGLAFINKLQPVTYNLNLNAADKIDQKPVVKDKDGKVVQLTAKEKEDREAQQKIIYTGFIAQDVEKAAKSVNYNFSGVDAPKNDKDLYALRYADFVAPLVKAVQELSKENDELKARLDKLEQLVAQNNAPVNASKSSITLSGASIAQNTPNPFKGITIVNYYLPQNSTAATIRINDMNGKLLKSYSVTAKGNGQLLIKASELSAGTYQYSLIVNGNIVDSKKMNVE